MKKSFFCSPSCLTKNVDAHKKISDTLKSSDEASPCKVNPLQQMQEKAKAAIFIRNFLLKIPWQKSVNNSNKYLEYFTKQFDTYLDKHASSKTKLLSHRLFL